ncbi:unnamed protein product [Aureobasidium vineae]|uniref:N-acetyltransferase domain-containing protein n=1 Tax=Aureobasidium vineae TaxID=2773715 RepID=A0A9N8PFV3_9PEZI|nr:unnamed protein product [Aureobasidium vineae]
MSTSFIVRAAVLLDAEAIAQIHVVAWCAAYVDIVPQTHLDSLTIRDKVTLWKHILSDPVKAAKILVAEEQAQVTRLLGFVSFGDAAAPSPNHKALVDGSTKTGELRAIYVDPQDWSKGAGRRLWMAAQQQLVEAQFTTVVVLVLARNERAIRFYEAAGFGKDGAGLIEIGGASLETVRLTKALT